MVQKTSRSPDSIFLLVITITKHDIYINIKHSLGLISGGFVVVHPHIIVILIPLVPMTFLQGTIRAPKHAGVGGVNTFLSV